jgi:integrase
VPRAKSGGARTIPLSPFAAEIVRRQLARRAGDCAWVFPSPVDPSKPVANVQKVWAAAKTAAGLPDHIVVHSLRHSFASALANSGIPLFEIGRVLGHRSSRPRRDTRTTRPSGWSRPSPPPPWPGT